MNEQTILGRNIYINVISFLNILIASVNSMLKKIEIELVEILILTEEEVAIREAETLEGEVDSRDKIIREEITMTTEMEVATRETTLRRGDIIIMILTTDSRKGGTKVETTMKAATKALRVATRDLTKEDTPRMIMGSTRKFLTH